MSLATAMAANEPDYADLIARARSGQAAQVLPQLRDQVHASPGDINRLADLFVVLHWADRDQDAVELLPALLRSDLPPYALPEIAKVGRRLSERGLSRQVLSFMNQQRQWQPEAFTVPLELDLLTMQRDSGDWLDAIAQADRLLLSYPESRELVLFKAETAARSGSYSIALDLLERHPQFFSREQAVTIRQDWQSQRVRVGAAMQSASDSPERLAASSAAVAHGYQWLETGDQGDPIFDRSRFDQIAALRDRDAMTEVIAMYRAIEGPVPDYVLIAAAEAYLRTRQPAKAAQLYELAIGGRKHSDTWEHRVSLAYALLDGEQQAAALEIIDEVAIEIGEAVKLGSPLRNDSGIKYWRERIEVVRANFERFAQRYDLASLRIDQALERAPFDADARLAKAGLLANRESPRNSLALIERVSLDFPDSAPARFAQADVLLDLNEVGQARQHITELENKLGEHPRLDRLQERIRHKIAPWAKVSIDSTVGEDREAPVTPVRERRIEAYAESQLIDNLFRFVISSSYHKAALPEGDTVRSRHGFGFTTENSLWALSAIGYRGLGEDSGGFGLRTRLTPSDAWTIRAGLTNNSEQAPLRAFRQGIKLITGSLQAEWRKLERRSVSASLEQGRFTDRNRRAVMSLDWRENWIRDPHISFSTVLSAATVGNRSTQTPYFSPSRYSTVSLAFIVQQTLSRSYDRWWKHQLRFEPTIYVQAGQANRLGGVSRYEHEVEVTSQFGLRAGVGHARRSFDGVLEGRWIASVESFVRF